MTLRPSFFKGRVPEWMVVQNQDSPFAVFFDVTVLVDTSFPPLARDMVTRGRIVFVERRFMKTSLHQCPGPDLGMEPVVIDVDNFLELRMVQEKPIVGAVTTSYEACLEVVNVKPLDPGSPFVYP